MDLFLRHCKTKDMSHFTACRLVAIRFLIISIRFIRISSGHRTARAPLQKQCMGIYFQLIWWYVCYVHKFTRLKPTCDVTAACLLETYLWCHSSLPDQNPLVMSQQLFCWKPTYDVIVAYLTETHMWWHSWKPTYDVIVAYLTEIHCDVTEAYPPTSDVIVVYLMDTHLWCHSSLPDRNTFVMSQQLTIQRDMWYHINLLDWNLRDHSSLPRDRHKHERTPVKEHMSSSPNYLETFSKKLSSKTYVCVHFIIFRSYLKPLA